MIRFLNIRLYLLLLVVVLVSACSNTRNLPSGESLFTGSKIDIGDCKVTHKQRRTLRHDLTGVVRPRPNSKFIGMRLKLRLYNFAGRDTKKKKGLRHWLRYQVGEPPV